MNQDSKIMIAGYRGMVGSAVRRELEKQGFDNLLLTGRRELDMSKQEQTFSYLKKERPEYLVIAAAKVGGIVANKTYQADFLYENLMIESNLIHGAFLSGVKKLLFLGSSCIYPKLAPQPIKEEHLLTGLLEPTNEGYALAKIAGLKMCDMYFRQHGVQFVSAMPCNLYGTGDYFHPENSHVIPALLQRFHNAKLNNDPLVTCWGSGKPRREFLFVDDLAEALVFMLREFEGPGFLNVGVGTDITIKELSELTAGIIGYQGEIKWDATKPDGTPQKLMDVDKLTKLGWQSSTTLEEGLRKTYSWFVENQASIRN